MSNRPFLSPSMYYDSVDYTGEDESDLVTKYLLDSIQEHEVCKVMKKTTSLIYDYNLFHIPDSRKIPLV